MFVVDTFIDYNNVTITLFIAQTCLKKKETLTFYIGMRNDCVLNGGIILVEIKNLSAKY